MQHEPGVAATVPHKHENVIALKTLHRSLVALLAILLFAAQGLLPEMVFAAQGPLPSIAQGGTQGPRGTQMGRGGRPTMVACVLGPPCPIVGLFNPGAAALGPIIMDPSTAVTCVSGFCGTPVPFLMNLTILGPTATAGATGGLGAGALLGATTAAVIPVSAALATGISTSIGDVDPTQTGSQ
jgi:hypothetical protein